MTSGFVGQSASAQIALPLVPGNSFHDWPASTVLYTPEVHGRSPSIPAYQVPVDRGSTSSACRTPVSCPSNGRLLQDAPPFVEENNRPLCAPAITKPRDFGTTLTSSASPPNGPVGLHSANATSRVSTPVSVQKSSSGPGPEVTAVLQR